MSHQVYVDHFACALGERLVLVEQSTVAGDTFSTAGALAEAGFRQHWVCRPQTNAYQLDRRAVGEIQSELGDIGAIVYSTASRPMPTWVMWPGSARTGTCSG